MLKLYRNSIAILILVLFAFTAKAQSNGTYSGFSPYSVYGVGNLHNAGTSWNRGMGGVGIAARNHRFVNILNPASVTARDTLSFMADFGLNGRISVFTEGDKKALNTTFNIDDFVISFPMWKNTALMVGVTPLSDVGYKITYSELNESNLNTGWQTFSTEGNGGIYQLFAGAGITLWKRLSLGAQANYNFGSIAKQASMTYEDESARSWAYGDSLQVNNFSAKFGLQYEQPLSAKSSLVLGATYRLSTPIGGYHTHYEVKGIDVTSGEFSKNLSGTGLRMGDELGVGLSFKRGDNLLIEFDYLRTDWRNSGMDSYKGFKNVGLVPFASSVGQSFRLGTEFTPNRNDIRYYLKRCTYRAGAYYDSSHYTVDGLHVDAMGITLGMTLPVFRWYNGVSIGLDFGRRGLHSSQVKEFYFGFNFGMNVFDIWFKKPKYE